MITYNYVYVNCMFKGSGHHDLKVKDGLQSNQVLGRFSMLLT